MIHGPYNVKRTSLLALFDKCVLLHYTSLYLEQEPINRKVGATSSQRWLTDLSITTTSQVMPDEWSDGCRAEGLPKRDGVAPPVH